MSAGNGNQATRLLAASAFLNGRRFRKQVVDCLDDPNRAAAPEPGMDLSLLAGVCQHAEVREQKYAGLYCLVSVAALLLLAFGTAHWLVLVLVVVVSGGLWF